MSGARFLLVLGAMVLSALGALAQETVVPFGGIKHDNSLPVEIVADSLNVDQATATAEFVGSVQVAQGTLKITADKISVKYASDETGATGEIESLHAFGHVLFTNGAEAAEGAEAEYLVATGIVTMTGDVMLTQGSNAMSGQSLRIDLTNGSASVEGRVQTIFQPATNP